MESDARNTNRSYGNCAFFSPENSTYYSAIAKRLLYIFQTFYRCPRRQKDVFWTFRRRSYWL